MPDLTYVIEQVARAIAGWAADPDIEHYEPAAEAAVDAMLKAIEAREVPSVYMVKVPNPGD